MKKYKDVKDIIRFDLSEYPLIENLKNNKEIISVMSSFLDMILAVNYKIVIDSRSIHIKDFFKIRSIIFSSYLCFSEWEKHRRFPDHLCLEFHKDIKNISDIK